MSPGNDPRLARTQIQKLVTDLQTILFGWIDPLTLAQRTAKTLYDELVSRDFPFCILPPKFNVYLPIRLVEDVGTGKIRPKIAIFIQFPESDNRIAIGVVQSVVKIDEQIGIFFHNQYILPDFISKPPANLTDIFKTA